MEYTVLHFFSHIYFHAVIILSSQMSLKNLHELIHVEI